MKRLISLVISVLLLCAAACAEGGSGAVAVGQITEISPGVPLDLDGDGDQESVRYEIVRDEDGYDTGFRMGIGDAAVEGSGWCMNEKLYALRISEYDTLILVSDYGPSDDYETHFYLYSNDLLIPAGSVFSMPESMNVNDGIITAPVRGKLLYTWFHDADFALANYWGESGETKAHVYQIPRWMYPMGLMVTLKTDLPVVISMADSDEGHTFQAGEEVILCATDDAAWVYVQSVESGAAGWMRAGGETGMECLVNGEWMFSWDVFEGLVFAD